MTGPSVDELSALLSARGVEVDPALLEDVAPAVRDMWRLGSELEHHVRELSEEVQ